MAALDLNAVMDGIGTRLLTISGLRVFDYLADNIQPPAAVVALAGGEYDTTFSRGSDRAVFDIYVLVSRVSDRASRDTIGPYIAGSGAKSIKATLDGTLAGTVQTARVMDYKTSMIPVAGSDYLAATFRLEVYS